MEEAVMYQKPKISEGTKKILKDLGKDKRLKLSDFLKPKKSKKESQLRD